MASGAATMATNDEGQESLFSANSSLSLGDSAISVDSI